MESNKWRKEWPNVLQRLRAADPTYVVAAKGRRVGIRKTEVNARVRSLHTRGLEVFLQRVLRVVFPAPLNEAPTTTVLTRLGEQTAVFGNRLSLRRLFRIHGIVLSTLLHEELV